MVIGQLRVLSHRLEIRNWESGGVPRAERICKLCHEGVESDLFAYVAHIRIFKISILASLVDSLHCARTCCTGKLNNNRQLSELDLELSPLEVELSHRNSTNGHCGHSACRVCDSRSVVSTPSKILHGGLIRLSYCHIDEQRQEVYLQITNR